MASLALPRLRPDESMKVTYDLIHFALTPYGGISHMWAEIFKNLPDPEIDATFIVGPADNLTQDQLECSGYYGQAIVREPASGLYRKIRRLGFYRNFHLMKLNLEGGEQIFHSTDYMNPLITRSSMKVVTTIHDMVFWDQKDRFVKNIWYYDKLWCTYHACRFSDHVITVSNAAKQSILAQFPWAEHKVSVIPHGLDVSLMDIPLSMEKDKSILFMGGRNGHKNFDLLARAFSVFSRDYPDWRFHLTGPNEHSLEREKRLFAELGIAEKVFDHGLVPQEKITSILSTAGVLVIPSLNEGFNFPLLEAMAAGCPVLSSNIPASRELADGHVSYFSPHSECDLIDRMRRLADRPPTTKQLSSAQKHARSFRWDNSYEALKTIYRNCLQ